MTDTVLPADADAAALQRRRFLRGGALLAAAAGGAVAATATGVTPARAEDATVLAASIALPPMRFLDTRSSEGRALIVDSSSGAFDSKRRLKKNAWLDVAVFPADADLGILSVFVNLGSRGSTKKGTLLVTEPEGGRSSAWTLHYGKGAEINNSAIVGVGVSEDETVYYVRVYAGSTTHVVLDLTGVSALLPLEPNATAARTSQRASAARVAAAARSLKR